MTIPQDEYQPSRWHEFRFYASGKVDGWEQQSITNTSPYRLREIRLHFSSVFVSTEDLVVYISNVNGSSYNTKVLSQALLNVQDYRITFTSMTLQSDDHIVFNGSMVSNVNGWGLEVLGESAHG